MARPTQLWWDHVEPIHDPNSSKVQRLVCYKEDDSERQRPFYIDLDSDDANVLRRQLLLGDNVVPVSVTHVDDNGEK